MTPYPRAHLYLSLAFLVAVAGFVPSYWSKPPSRFDLWVHIHGISATLFFALTIAQAWLAKSGRFRAHRPLGIAALVNATVAVVSMLVIAPNVLKIPFPDPDLGYAFYFVDVIAVGLFAVLVLLAMRHRRDMELHSRYIIAALLAPLPAAASRLLRFFELAPSPWSATVISGVLLLAVYGRLIYDDYEKGRIYPPYVLVYAGTTVISLGFEPVGRAGWWQGLVNHTTPVIDWVVLTIALGWAWRWSSPKEGARVQETQPQAEPLSARAET